MGLEFVCVFGHDAHAGTYREGRHGIELVAEQTISVSPEKTLPFSELGRTEHKLSVERLGETLVITFGSGTVNCSLVTLPVDQVLAQDAVGGAVRFEHFDIFGATTNGKLSVRYGLGDAVSVRGGVSTGFRAPTPGQQNTLNVQTTIDPETLELVDSANVPSTFRAAELRGGQPLQPETSFNSTVGLVVDTGPFTLTADYFRVDVSNRLALSQTFTLTTDERALLLSEGITSAGTLAFFRFFINDFSSRTQGIDLVSTYTPPAFAGDTVFSVTMNYTDTEVTKESDLLGPGDILGLTRGVPKTRWNVALSQRVGRVGLLGRLNYYGSWVDHFDARFVRGPAAPVLDGRYIVDLEASKQGRSIERGMADTKLR